MLQSNKTQYVNYIEDSKNICWFYPFGFIRASGTSVQRLSVANVLRDDAVAFTMPKDVRLLPLLRALHVEEFDDTCQNEVNTG